MPRRHPVSSRTKNASSPASRGQGSSRFRIVGGQWRGRRFDYPLIDGLRPTPDRLRETLFNWLAPEIVGARCLDLFAGSGALGLEALSRGAGFCQFVELGRAQAQAIQQHVEMLDVVDSAAVQGSDALRFLDRDAEGFDLVFLDPPFRQGILQPVVDRLIENGWLAADGKIYCETEVGAVVPPSLRLLKQSTAGQVCAGLYCRA